MGTGGRLSIFRSGYKFIPSKQNPQLTEVSVPGVNDTHMNNWLDCMRSRKQPNADVMQGHYSAMACHIGNIAYREKTRTTWRKEWEL
jgi:hypothetical protein